MGLSPQDPHFAALKSLVLDGACLASGRPEVRTKARALLLDTLACALCGRQAKELVKWEQALAQTDPGVFRFPGGSGLSSLAAAAIAASASAWDEACEGLPYAHGRPGLSLVGALLALAVQRNASLDSVLDALIAGYEVGGRAGGWLRIRPRMHVDGNWPALGVAAGVAKLLGLEPYQRWQAVCSVACQMPASLYLPIRTGDDVRNLYTAHSAWLGMLAVSGAMAGISAPETALLEVAAEHAQPDGREAPEASRVLLLESYFKPHAGVRHAHYGLEAATQIRGALQENTGAIREIRLRIYDEAIRYAGNRDPQAPITGQFSLSLGIAAGLRFGGMRPELFRTSDFYDPELRRLEKLVAIEPDPDLATSGARAATLEVFTDSLLLSRRVSTLPGDPALPVETEHLISKFVRYSSFAVEERRASGFAQALLFGDGSSSFAALWTDLIGE